MNHESRSAHESETENTTQFLDTIQRKLEHETSSDKVFFDQFSWEELEEALEILSDPKENTGHPLFSHAQNTIRELKAARTYHFTQRIETRVRETFLDTPTRLFRAVESTSDPKTGGITWWTPDEVAARKYANKYTPPGKVYALNITLSSDKQMNWTVDRNVENPSEYTYGISYGNDAVDGGYYDPVFMSLGEDFIEKNGTIEEV